MTSEILSIPTELYVISFSKKEKPIYDHRNKRKCCEKFNSTTTLKYNQKHITQRFHSQVPHPNKPILSTVFFCRQRTLPHTHPNNCCIFTEIDVGAYLDYLKVMTSIEAVTYQYS